MRTVSPVFVLAQIHIHAGSEGTAEDVVHCFDGNFIGIILRWSYMASKDYRMDGTGAINQVHRGLFLKFDMPDVLFGDFAICFPGAKLFFQLGNNFIQGCISNYNQRCIVWFKPGVMELAHVSWS